MLAEGHTPDADPENRDMKDRGTDYCPKNDGTVLVRKLTARPSSAGLRVKVQKEEAVSQSAGDGAPAGVV